MQVMHRWSGVDGVCVFRLRVKLHAELTRKPRRTKTPEDRDLCESGDTSARCFQLQKEGASMETTLSIAFMNVAVSAFLGCDLGVTCADETTETSFNS